MLLTEALILLLTDDESGKLTTGSADLTLPLGGAVLLELLLQGRVEFAAEDGGDLIPELRVLDGSETADDVLDVGLQVITDHPDVTEQSVLGALGEGALEGAHRSLVAKGILEQDDERVLGIFPRHRWPAETSDQEVALRSSIDELLRTDAPADDRVYAITALLSAASCLTHAVDHEHLGMTSRELLDRGVAVSTAPWAPHGLRVTVEQIRAAVQGNQSSVFTTFFGGP